jgi:hypothetical protein
VGAIVGVAFVPHGVAMSLHVVGAAGGAVAVTISGVDVDSTAGVSVRGVVGVAALVDVVVWLVAGSAAMVTLGVVLSLVPQVIHRMLSRFAPSPQYAEAESCKCEDRVWRCDGVAA